MSNQKKKLNQISSLETSEDDSSKNEDLTLDFPHHHIVIQNRYEVLHILNDILIGLWFLIGSFFFFSDALQEAGTWLFVVGSAQMLVRPVIRIAHRIHIRKITN